MATVQLLPGVKLPVLAVCPASRKPSWAASKPAPPSSTWALASLASSRSVSCSWRARLTASPRSATVTLPLAARPLRLATSLTAVIVSVVVASASTALGVPALSRICQRSVRVALLAVGLSLLLLKLTLRSAAW